MEVLEILIYPIIFPIILIAGIASGPAILYFWHRIMERKNQKKNWFKWVCSGFLRAICVSLVLGLGDMVTATKFSHAFLSFPLFTVKDGGTEGSVGFGYLLLYHRKMYPGDNNRIPPAEYGPEIWYWFLPFTICDTNEKTGITWLWQRRQHDLFYLFK